MSEPRAAAIAPLPRRLELRDVTPDGLAGVLREIRNGRVDLRGALADRLIDLTVRQARDQSPFYADLYADLDPDCEIGKAELARLPVIERRDVEAAGTRIASRYASYSFTTYTSGTTSGRSLLVDRSEQEAQYLRALLGALEGRSLAPTPQDRRPALALVAASWDHGRQLGIPSSTYTFPVSLAGPAGFGQAAQLLERSYRIDGADRRINAVGGPGSRIVQLTAYLRAEGLGALAEPVELVQTTSTNLTAFARRELEDFWGCRVVDRFSLAECFVGAASCPTCSWYHFDDFGFAEAVDLRSGERIDQGRGALALTAYYPFTQMTPFIRYRPGDLVEVREVDCPDDSRGWRFLGREAAALGLDAELGPGAFLGAAEVLEALDPLGEVARVPDPALPRRCGTAGRLPLFTLGREGGRATLSIEAAFDPDDDPERARRLRSAVERDLAGTSADVAGLIHDRRLAVRLVPPSTLAERDAYRV